MQTDNAIEQLGGKMGIELKLADPLLMTSTVAGAAPADQRETVDRLLLLAIVNC